MLPLVLSLLAAPAPAVTVTFEPPAGWTRAEGDGEVDFTPPGLPRGAFAQLQIWPSQQTRDFNRWFAESWGKLTDGHGGVQASNPQVANGPDHQLTLIGASMEAGPNHFVYLMFAAAHREGRVQPVLFITDDNGAYQAHLLEVQNVLQGMAFLPRSAWPPVAAPGAEHPHPYRPPRQGAPPMNPPPAGPAASGDVTPSFTWGEVPRATGNAGLDGVFTAMQWHTNWTHTWIEPKHDYFVFWPDGRAARVLPDEGLFNFNWNYSHAANPMFYGRYDLSSGQIVWDGGGGSMRLEKVKGGVRVDGNGPFLQLERCNGAKLNGTYRRSDWKTLVGAEAQGAFITFHPDGTFQERNTLVNAGGMWWRPPERGGYLNEEYAPAGSGTYSVDDFSLTLLYASGKKRRINFHLASGVTCADPKGFVLNTWTFARDP